MSPAAPRVAATSWKPTAASRGGGGRRPADQSPTADRAGLGGTSGSACARPAAGARPAATLWATSGYGFRVRFQLLPPLGERGEQRQALGPEFVIDRDRDLRLYVFAG